MSGFVFHVSRYTLTKALASAIMKYNEKLDQEVGMTDNLVGAPIHEAVRSLRTVSPAARILSDDVARSIFNAQQSDRKPHGYDVKIMRETERRLRVVS